MKKKTLMQKKNKLNIASTCCFIGEFVSLILPYVIIIIANYDKYFIAYNGTKMTLACILTITLMAMMVWIVAKKKFDSMYLSLVLGWATTTLIFYLLGQVITDIATIMLFGLIGLVGAYILDTISKNCEKQANEIKDAMNQAKKENMVEEYKKEIRKKDEVANDGDLLG